MSTSAKAEVCSNYVATQHTESARLYTQAVDLAMSALDGTINRSIAKLKLLEIGYQLERVGDDMCADCVRRLIKRLAP